MVNSYRKCAVKHRCDADHVKCDCGLAEQLFGAGKGLRKAGEDEGEQNWVG